MAQGGLERHRQVVAACPRAAPDKEGTSTRAGDRGSTREEDGRTQLAFTTAPCERFHDTSQDDACDARPPGRPRKTPNPQFPGAACQEKCADLPRLFSHTTNGRVGERGGGRSQRGQLGVTPYPSAGIRPIPTAACEQGLGNSAMHAAVFNQHAGRAVVCIVRRTQARRVGPCMYCIESGSM